MKKVKKGIMRLIAFVLTVALLPVWNVLPLMAKAETVEAPVILENTTLHQSVVVTNTLIIRGEVILADGAEILVESGTVTVGQGAVLRGNVTLSGEDAKLSVAGTLDGDVNALGTRSRVDIAGRIKGTLTIGCTGAPAFDVQSIRLDMYYTAFLEKLVLDGGGMAYARGKINTIEATDSNKTHLEMDHIQVKTMTLRSDAQCWATDSSSFEEIFLYCDELNFEKYGNASLSLAGGSKAGTVHVYGGMFDHFNGTHVDKVFVHGKGAYYHLEIFDESEVTPTLDELYILGAPYNVMTRGEIGFCYMERGFLQNYGHIGTFVMAGGELWSEFGGQVGEHDVEATHRFPYLYDNYIQRGGWADLVNEIPAKRAVLLGGDAKTDNLKADKPLLDLRGKGLHRVKKLTEGTQKVTSGDVLTVDAPAYSALTLNLTGEGGVLVEEPGNFYTWVEGGEASTLLTRETGTVRLTVLGEGELSLDAALEDAVEVNVDLSYRYAAARGEQAKTEKLSLSDRKLTLKKQDGKTIETILTESALYAMPETAQPGEKLILQIEGEGDVPLTLDGNRHAAVSYSILESGRYEGTPTDEARAHLYLYNAQGDFMREVFFSEGSYNTGALADGSYNVLWIRGGIGGWMLPRLSDFEANGLQQGKHYTLERITIRSGEVLRSSPNIPAEPTLQSPYLKAEGTSYSTALSTVTAGGLVMMTLKWDFSGSEWTEAVAKMEFSSGAKFVKDSAIIGTGKAEATWKNNVLTVPLRETSGTLRFYMEASESQENITSSAFVVFGKETPISQYVGSTRTVIAPLSIQAPGLTPTKELTVSGYSLPFGIVGVYDNDRLAAWCTTDGNGWWNSKITLSAETDHTLTVKSEDGQAVSDPVKVKIAAGAPVLQRFTVDYVEHGVAKKVSLEGDRFGLDPLRFAYEPNTYVTFTIELKNDDSLEALTLVAERNSYQERMEATRVAEGKWVIASPMSKDRAFTPDWLYLEYTFREDAMDTVFTRDYAEVPVLDNLDYHADLGGALNRYYPADPYYHDVDVGFGAGWVTDYTVRAELAEEGGQTFARIYTPNGQRYFIGTGNSLTEAGGYAAAKVTNGALTVTESDGGMLIFDKNGWLKTVQTPYGEKTELTWKDDALQKVTTGGEVLQLIYDETGHVVSARCGDSLAEYTYENGCLIRVQEDEEYVHYSYTSGGIPYLAGFRGSDQGNGSVRYDNQGRPVMISLNGETTILSYGENTVEVTEAGTTIKYTLENGSVTGATTSDGISITTEAKDGIRALNMLKDGQTIYRTEYDEMGNLTSETDVAGTVRYGYDDRGNLNSVTDAAGKTTAYGYDKQGNLASITYADGSAETYAYDNKGNLTVYTDRAGAVTRYSYDGSGNLTAIENPDGTKITREQGVNDEGNLWQDYAMGEVFVNINRHPGGSNYNFADHNFEIGTGDYRIYRMDEYGAVSRYDGERMTGVTTENDESLTAYTYNDAGQVVSETRGNGTTTQYSYDASGNLTRLENRASDGKVLSFYAMTHDESGNILTMETAEGKWTYTYDDASQLIASLSPAGKKTEYAYDKAGNRVSVTVDGKKTAYQTNKLNQIVSAGTAKFTYDKAGNLLSDGINTYKWNQLGQLIEVTDGKNTTSYTYDLFGNRQTRTVNGETTTYYTMPTALPLVLGQTDKYGETRYYYGDNGLVAAEINGQRVYYLFDPFGSVSEIVDGSGNVLCSFRYDEWGEVTTEKIAAGDLAKAAAAQNLRRHARYGLTDEGNGLIYARARYISTNTGSFISPDPAGQTYDLNLYRYADNNPVMFMDITGENEILVVFGPSNPGDPIDGYKLIHEDDDLAVYIPELTLTPRRGSYVGWMFTIALRDVLKWSFSTWLDPFSLGWCCPYWCCRFRQCCPNADCYLDICYPDECDHKCWDSPFGPNPPIPSPTPILPSPPEPDDVPPYIWPGPGGPGDVDIDPSGYVYEAVASNRLSGVTATVYWRDEDGTAVKWDAAAYDQINPQITDFLGQYAWYVPEGMWRVTYSLPGYEDTQTGWLPVPPPQTEVNVGMVSKQAPTVTHAARFADGIEVTFSKYMDMDSVSKDLAVLDKDGKNLPVTVKALNAEKMVAEDREVASRFLVVCQGEAEKLTLSGKAVSYAGTPIAPVTVEPKAAYRLESLGLDAEYNLTAEQTHTLKLQLKGEGGYETMAFTTEIMGGSCVENIVLSIPDAQGVGELSLNATVPGRATLRIREENSGFTQTIQLVIAPQEQ